MGTPSGTIRTYRHFFINTFVLRFVFLYPCLVVPHQTGSACIGVPEKTRFFGVSLRTLRVRGP